MAKKKQQKAPLLNRVSSWLFTNAVTVLLVLAVLSLGTRIYLEQFWEPEEVADQLPPPRAAMQQLQTQTQLQRIEAAIEVYRLKHGNYPGELVDLTGEGLMTQAALRFPGFERQYFYRLVGDSYELYPPKM